MNKQYHAFISYASEDLAFVKPLAEKLGSVGLKIWFDKFCLKPGDSIMKKIEEGLVNSDYGIVVLSTSFFDKKWPQEELSALYQLQISGRSAILPIWKEIDKEYVQKYSPLLADKFAVKYYDGIDKNVADLLRTIDPENSYIIKQEMETIAKQINDNAKAGNEIDIRVEASVNRKFFGSISKYYDISKEYIMIEVQNWGNREVIIAKAGFHRTDTDKPIGIASDSIYFGPKRLKDGEVAQYFIEQSSIDLKKLDYVWASDMVGRIWKGEIKKGS